jgi:hypothetical protein
MHIKGPHLEIRFFYLCTFFICTHEGQIFSAHSPHSISTMQMDLSTLDGGNQMGVIGVSETHSGVLLSALKRRQICQSSAVERWDRFSQSILKQGYWSRLGNLTKSLVSLPHDIEAIYNEIEERSPVRLNAGLRLMYYSEFTRAALGSTTLHFKDVEALIKRKNPEIMISKIDFLTLMTSKFHELSKGTAIQAENSEYIDYRHFAALLYDLFKHHEDMTRSKEGRWGLTDIMRQFPLDPDSSRKQIWDSFCMILLLYCSFSVPFSIAFETSSEQENGFKENFDVFTDVVFMLDICLNFITAWDNQGFVVREFSLIAKNYLRTWFVPDIAGSFPFDKVITALVDSGPQSVSSSSTVLRGLRLIRMIKLVRAIKFMTKLEKLKHQEGFEAFGAAITLISTGFALFFTSHLLGCFYTILIAYEDGDNWLLSYSPELVTAEVSTRYVTALYWAMITIRFGMGACVHSGGLLNGNLKGMTRAPM